MRTPKNFGGLLLGISVLPALLVMPALAEISITADTNLNEKYSDGIINETLSSTTGLAGKFSTPIIKIAAASGMGVKVSGENSRLELGADTENVTNDISISAQRNFAVSVKENSSIVIGSDKTQNLEIITQSSKSALNVNNSKADLTAKNININGKYRAVYAVSGSQVNVNGDDITLSAKTNNAVVALDDKTKININGKNINISTDTNEPYAAVHAGEGGAIAITGENINITGKQYAVGAMSKGHLDIIGNTTLSARSAILARGDSEININKDRANTVKIDGDISFDYSKPTSGDKIDANVNVYLSGAESYWNGNTVTMYTGVPETDGHLIVTHMNLELTDGAVWNAAKIADDRGEDNGRYYIPLNKLNVDGGTVNIADTERGITIDQADISDAAFNGPSVTITNALNVNGGVNKFDSNICGDAATVNIANGATLDMGAANIDVDTINLDGTLITTLSDTDSDARLNANSFTGAGKLSLIAKSEGQYKVFGNAVFGGDKTVDINSVLYNMNWQNDGATVKLDMKTAQDIAADNGLSADASQTVMNVVGAESDTLNDFGLLIQERLATGDIASVEHAHKAINPADTSVVQSVASTVQSTVAKLAANRMTLPALVGRSGGDVDLTAGSVWAQGLFNKSKKNGEFSGYTRGIAAGIDGTVGRVFTLGAGYAFNHSDLDLNSRDTEIDSNTVFVYGQYKPSAWYANATLNYTMSDYEESGRALGVAIASDYKINAFGGQVMTGYDFANGLTPEAGVRYLHINGDTYTNSLGIKNKIDDADYLTAILGGKYVKSFAISDVLILKPELRLAAKYDLMSDEYDAAVAMPGINSYSVHADRLNRLGGEAGLGLTMSYKDIDLFVTYDIEVRKDYTSQIGMVRAKYNF